MEDHESIDQMFGRFQTIINNLRQWRSQVITLEASKDLKKFHVEEIIGTLKFIALNDEKTHIGSSSKPSKLMSLMMKP
ncbi:hypothetical protein CR513_15059, partial [Mucuna pruriens]